MLSGADDKSDIKVVACGPESQKRYAYIGPLKLLCTDGRVPDCFVADP